MWEKDIDIHQVAEIRSKSVVYLGVGAIAKIDDIATELREKGISRIIAVTGKNAYRSTGAWDYCAKAFEKNEIIYEIYDNVMPNPEVDQVDEATKLALDFGAEAVIAIGGGSPIDAAKSVAILMKYPDKTARDLFGYQFAPEEAAPIIAINLTHGTGTEIDRFAVVTIPEKQQKPYIANDAIYPLYAIDDPALMTSLPKDQTIYVSVDAINHIVEACTSNAASPYSILMAKETVRLVAKYLPIAIREPENLKARYYLAYASMIAGISFDNGLLHYTHALEHPLSGVNPKLTHGLGLSLLLPSVVKYIYKEKPNTLADVLAPLAPGLTGTPDEAESIYCSLKNWLTSLGIKMGLSHNGFGEKDIPLLVDLVFETPGLGDLVGLAPGNNGKDSVKEIYADAL